MHNLIISRRQMIGIVLVLLVAGCHRTTPDTAAPSREQALTPSPTLTLSPVPTAVPTATPTTTPTSTPTPTATMTPSPTATPTDLPPPTPVNELRPSRFTRVQQGVFFSQSRQVAIEFTLFTPPSYEEGTERYPVLYFLHGVSGSEILFWNAIGREVTAANGDAGAWLSQLMLDGLIPPLLIVAPDDTDGFWGDMNEVMVTEELVAFVDENWRTIPGREGRTIAGFSMGGFGTAVYAARHPDLYCSAMIMALGGSDEYLTIWQENQTDIVASGLLIGLLVGEDDRSGFKGTNELHETLNQLEIGHTFTVVPGVVHNFGQLYNAAGLEALQFQTQCLAR